MLRDARSALRMHTRALSFTAQRVGICRVVANGITHIPTCPPQGDSTCQLDSEIVGRLEAGEKPTVGYGMLMERLMAFRSKAVSAEGSVVFDRLLPFAEERLKSTSLHLEAPVRLHLDRVLCCPCGRRAAARLGRVSSLIVSLQAGRWVPFDGRPSTRLHPRCWWRNIRWPFLGMPRSRWTSQSGRRPS